MSDKDTERVILDKIGNWPTRCFKTILRALVFWNACMACTKSFVMPWYGHNMSVATWFTPVPCIGLTVLSSNGWADLLASKVSPFHLHHTIVPLRILGTLNSS